MNYRKGPRQSAERTISASVAGRALSSRHPPSEPLRGPLEPAPVRRIEFRPDLDVPALADIVCQLHVDYSTRAYLRDPHYPADPALIDAVVELIREAVAAR